MKTLLLLSLLLLLPACASMQSPNMSADELKAVAADKNFSAVCSSVTGVWGTGKVVYVNVDKTVVPNGAVSVDANCLVTMSNTTPVRPLAVEVKP